MSAEIIHRWRKTNGTYVYADEVNPLPVTGLGGGGVTIADGADVAEGATTDTAYVSGNGTNNALLKGIFGKLAARTAANAATTSVGGSASSVTLLAANANRVAYSVYNDSTAILYLLEDNSAAASSSNYTWQIAPGGGWINDEYTGKVVGIWASATGNARITERTP